MAHPVFLSYARSASLPFARAVYEALGGAGEDLAFLDEVDIDYGERFPERIIDELLGARVVVIFAEPVYFTRWYCLLEFRLARTAFLKSLEPGSSLTPQTAIAPLVLALPPTGTPPEVDRFPPLAQATNWPSVNDPSAIAALVRRRLEQSPHSLGDLLDRADAADLRNELLEATRLPPPLPAGRAPRAPLEIAPSIRDAFVGRADDLWRLDDLLTTRDGGPAATAALAGSIEGGGGLGKTRLALEYLHRFGPKRFPGGLFWIDADVDPTILEARQHEILQALDPSALPLHAYHDPQQPRSLRQDLQKAVFAIPTDAPALFMVDNVPEPESGEPTRPLTSWCPAVGIAPVLATSRSRISLSERGAVTTIQVDVLDAGAAVSLLTRGVPDRQTLSEHEWIEVAEWVGRLPLALELLNAVLQGGAMSSQELLARARRGEITRELDNAMEALRPTVQRGSLRGVTEALSISYEKLSEREQAAARLLSWLAPEPIPTEVLTAVGTEPFSAPTRGVLVHRSFVTRGSSEEVPIYGTMHRVLSDFLQTRSPDAAGELGTLTTALAQVMELSRCRDPRHWPLLMRLLPHARRVVNHGMQRAARISHWHNLGLGIATLLNAKGLFGDAAAVLEEIVATCSCVVGAEHPDTLACLTELASSYHSQGDYARAGEMHVQILEVRRRVLGEEHPDTLSSIHQVARTHHAQGHYTRAAELHQQLMEMRQRVLGEEHPDTLTSISSVASSLHANGDFARAAELYGQVLEVRRRILGEESLQTIHSMNDVARSLHARGHYARASEMHRQVMEVSRRVLGEEHPDTLTSMSNLASSLRAKGDQAHAAELNEQVLEIRGRVLGEEHPHTLSSMSTQASALLASGAYARAAQLYEQMVEIRRRVLGEEHPETLVSKSNLAISLHAIGDRARAAELHQKVLDVRRRVLGEEHPHTLFSMHHEARTHHAQGHYARAAKLHQRVLETRRRVLGEEHPDTLTSTSNLAASLHAIGDRARAAQLRDQVLKIRQRVLGEEHPNTLISMSEMARTEHAQGHYARAAELHKQVFEIRRRDLGDEHPDTLISKSNWATALLARGDYAGAAELHEQAVEVCRRILGEEHPDTLLSIASLATSLRANGDHARAAELHERVVEIRRRILGEEHPDTLFSMHQIARTHYVQGHYARAAALHEQVVEIRRRVLGEEHPHTLTSMNDVALTFRAQGLYARAAELHQHVLEARSRVLGEEHPDTLRSRRDLSEALREQGQDADP
jgi:tetratricopeptide (TPR) repeat protein